MIDLKRIEDAAAIIVAAVPRIQSGVAALQSTSDPTAQTRVDALAETLIPAAAALKTVADGLATSPPPPPPPTGPPA